MAHVTGQAKKPCGTRKTEEPTLATELICPRAQVRPGPSHLASSLNFERRSAISEITLTRPASRTSGGEETTAYHRLDLATGEASVRKTTTKVVLSRKYVGTSRPTGAGETSCPCKPQIALRCVSLPLYRTHAASARRSSAVVRSSTFTILVLAPLRMHRRAATGRCKTKEASAGCAHRGEATRLTAEGNMSASSRLQLSSSRSSSGGSSSAAATEAAAPAAARACFVGLVVQR